MKQPPNISRNGHQANYYLHSEVINEIYQHCQSNLLLSVSMASKLGKEVSISLMLK